MRRCVIWGRPHITMLPIAGLNNHRTGGTMKLTPWLVIGALSCSLPQFLNAQLTGFVFRTKDPNAADTILVYADGNLRNTLAQNDQTTVAAGALGIGLRNRTVLLDLLINAAGTTAPLTTNHAATMLVPGSGGSLSAGYGEMRYRPGTRIGARAYVSVSTANWTDTVTSKTISTLVGGVGAGGFINLFGGTVSSGTDESNGTRIAGVLDVGVSWRTLGGDIVDKQNNQQLVNILGSNDKDRFGLEIALTLQVNDLKAGFTYYRFGGEVPGFSKGQVVAGFSVSTAIVSGPIH
jgi:hypothetical protein